MSGPARARVLFHAGRVVAIEMPDDRPLGELLQLDPAAHGEALGRGRVHGPVGAWLVREGLASEGDVLAALRRQLRVRVGALLRWPDARLRFAPVAAPLPTLHEPVPVIDLVLGGLRDALGSVPAAASRRLRTQRWGLSPLGEALLPKAALWPEERAMAGVLERPLGGDSVLSIGAHRPRALRALYAWHLLGLVTCRRAGTRHGVLLRKRHQLRHAASPADLLELREHGDARRGLRRLLRDVHPDRFEPSLQTTSGEVVQALMRAERKLRG
ncbi:MAG: hypothetical protein CMN31_12745 [Sandaracinus sp.]|nr:hypothetical protein [Myxococcales bacterium]MAT23725.1 hypothetical protein [Sandaracinus sp.]MBJ72189.1 hypothetical protein [Sandaracinus sp.]